MSVRLKIPTGDAQVAFDLISKNGSLQPGTEVTTPGGAKLRFERLIQRQGTGEGRLEFVLSGEDGVAVEPLADWLYETLKGRVPEFRVGRSGVPVEPDAIRQALAGKLSS